MRHKTWLCVTRGGSAYSFFPNPAPPHADVDLLLTTITNNAWNASLAGPDKNINRCYTKVSIPRLSHSHSLPSASAPSCLHDGCEDERGLLPNAVASLFHEHSHSAAAVSTLLPGEQGDGGEHDTSFLADVQSSSVQSVLRRCLDQHNTSALEFLAHPWTVWNVREVPWLLEKNGENLALLKEFILPLLFNGRMTLDFLLRRAKSYVKGLEIAALSPGGNVGNGGKRQRREAATGGGDEEHQMERKRKLLKDDAGSMMAMLRLVYLLRQFHAHHAVSSTMTSGRMKLRLLLQNSTWLSSTSSSSSSNSPCSLDDLFDAAHVASSEGLWLCANSPFWCGQYAWDTLLATSEPILCQSASGEAIWQRVQALASARQSRDVTSYEHHFPSVEARRTFHEALVTWAESEILLCYPSADTTSNDGDEDGGKLELSRGDDHRNLEWLVNAWLAALSSSF